VVAASADEALRNAYAYSTCRVGRCLQYTRTWLEVGAYWPTAARAWEEAVLRHPGDRDPPRGAPMMWTGGSHGYGHIALSTGGGYVRSTDVPYAGMVRTLPLSWFGTHWPNLHYAGWTEDLNGATIKWLAQAPPPPSPEPAPPPPQTPGDEWMGTIDAISQAAAQTIGVQTSIQMWERYKPGGKSPVTHIYETNVGVQNIVQQVEWLMDATAAIAAHQGVVLPPRP